MSAHLQQEDPTKASLLNLKTGSAAVITRCATAIGRSADNDIITTSDSAVSRQHALILFIRDSFYVEDLGSRNGTYLNGKPLSGRMPLKTGDHIHLGMTFFMFQGQSIQSPVSLQSQTQDFPVPPAADNSDKCAIRHLRRIAPR